MSDDQSNMAVLGDESPSQSESRVRSAATDAVAAAARAAGAAAVSAALRGRNASSGHAPLRSLNLEGLREPLGLHHDNGKVKEVLWQEVEALQLEVEQRDAEIARLKGHAETKTEDRSSIIRDGLLENLSALVKSQAARISELEQAAASATKHAAEQEARIRELELLLAAQGFKRHLNGLRPADQEVSRSSSDTTVCRAAPTKVLIETDAQTPRAVIVTSNPSAEMSRRNLAPAATRDEGPGRAEASATANAAGLTSPAQSSPAQNGSGSVGHSRPANLRHGGASAPLSSPPMPAPPLLRAQELTAAAMAIPQPAFTPRGHVRATMQPAVAFSHPGATSPWTASRPCGMQPEALPSPVASSRIPQLAQPQLSPAPLPAATLISPLEMPQDSRSWNPPASPMGTRNRLNGVLPAGGSLQVAPTASGETPQRGGSMLVMAGSSTSVRAAPVAFPAFSPESRGRAYLPTMSQPLEAFSDPSIALLWSGGAMSPRTTMQSGEIRTHSVTRVQEVPLAGGSLQVGTAVQAQKAEQQPVSPTGKEPPRLAQERARPARSPRSQKTTLAEQS